MMAPQLYTFYGATDPAVGSVMITAHALGIPLEIKELDFAKGDHLAPEYLKLNPQHTVPTFVDDDGFAVWDSHAINAYLVGKYGKDDSLYPKDHRKRALVDQRLHFESGVLFPALRTVDMALVKKEIKEVPPHMVQAIKNGYDFLEIFLQSRKWVAGDTVTIADFNLVSTVACLDYHVKVDSKAYPNVTNWIKGAEALPCFASHSTTVKSFATFFDSLKE